MRDLKKDKAMCNAEITETPGAYTIDVEELEKGFYMWRERAIKAEAENARLRKVLCIAQEVVNSNRGGLVPGYKFSKLEQALAKLDKEES